MNDCFLYEPKLDLGVVLSENIYWLNVPHRLNNNFSIEIEIFSETVLSNRKAIIVADVDDFNILTDSDFVLSHDKQVGYYRYLNTGKGYCKTKINFSLNRAEGIKRLGIRTWWPEGLLHLKALRLKFFKNRQIFTNITVDVEALPGRANNNHIDCLIYGNLGDGNYYGIEMLCDIFERYSAKATFFVDFTTALLYGKESLLEAARTLHSRGHDVQLHVHPEIYARNKKILLNEGLFPSFENLPSDIALNAISFGANLYFEALGFHPLIIRPGALKNSKELYKAAKLAGLKAVSTLYRGYNNNVWDKISPHSTLICSNGLVEIPLDISLDPLKWNDSFKNEFDSIVNQKREQKIISLLLHSTSLLYRDNYPNATFFKFQKSYYDDLIRYVEFAAERGKFITSEGVLNSSRHDLAFNVDYEKITSELFNEINFIKKISFELLDLNKNHEFLLNNLPPMSLPLKMANGQLIFALYHADYSSRDPLFFFIKSSSKVYLLLNRWYLPLISLLDDALSFIRSEFNDVTEIIAESVILSESFYNYSHKTEVRKTFLINLTGDFTVYKDKFISKKLSYDLEREVRRLNELFNIFKFDISQPSDVPFEKYSDTVNLIHASLANKGVLSNIVDDIHGGYEVFKSSGLLIELVGDGIVLASAVCYIHKKELYFGASGQIDFPGNFSLGKILVYKLLNFLNENDFLAFHLGGGDFGYKSRFGGVETPLFRIVF